MSGPRFTVFTPTFDRARTLPRVRESLLAQTFRDFEWLVLDDGSRDGTPDLLAAWARDGSLPIRVLRQENRGKHVAVNRGVAEARGRLFLIFDSDDACVPLALERFLLHWEAIPESSRDGFSGVVARCADPSGRPIGDPFPGPVLDVSPLEARYRWGIRGELWGFTRTDLLRRFPFPEEREKTYIPESLVWDRVAATHRARFVDEILRIYHLEPGEGSLGSPKDPARGAWGNMLQHRMVLNEQIGWFREAPAELLRSAVHFARFSLHSGEGIGAQRRSLGPAASRLLWASALPLGIALYLRDRSRTAWTRS